jgi:hypothetical protein
VAVLLEEEVADLEYFLRKVAEELERPCLNFEEDDEKDWFSAE